MKYMGSKSRFVKDILPIMLKDRVVGQWYVEPFAGGMNVICEAGGNRIANDINPYLIRMWRALTDGWKPTKITREEYHEVKQNPSNYPAHYVGWVGFSCSYSGKFFGGFAGETRTKIGTVRDYQAEAIRNVARQVDKMVGVVFQNLPYQELEIPTGSIVYCDPPYSGTTGYADNIDHAAFWNWVIGLSARGNTVFVSEYEAPAVGFECIWEKEASSSLSANGISGGNKTSTEKLFLCTAR